MTRSVRALSLVLLLASSAHAQVPTSEAVAAHVRFEEGVQHARRGDVALAMVSFEAAYAIRPHFSVLYNIAQAHSALGNPVQAIATFDRYVAEGGVQLSQSRREAVERLLELERQRVGAVVIQVASPQDTRVWLDGRELTVEQCNAPISLKVGDHTLLYSHSAGHPVALVFKVPPGETSRQQVPAPPPRLPTKGQLDVQCEAPDVEVAIDGTVVASTPLVEPLVVDAGVREVRFSRPGFLSSTVDIDASPTRVSRVGCNVRWQAPSDARFTARLFVRTTPGDAHVFVDGLAFVGGVLPAGRHLVRVERDGYLPDVRTVSLRPGGGQRHEVALTPTPAQMQRDTERRSRRRALATILAGGGAASLVAGSTLFAWNQRRFDELRSSSRDLPTGPSPGRVASVQRVDDAAIGLGALGLSLAIAATWTLLSD